MAGTPIICRASVRRWGEIQRLNKTRSGSHLPLPKTSKTGQLDSEEKNQPDEQQISDSHQLCLQLPINTNIA